MAPEKTTTINAESQEMEVPGELDNQMLAMVSKAEIDMQIATAKQYPRDIKRFIVDSTSLACMDEQIAGECYYRLERRGRNGKIKVIEGPSARLAEIVASTWGNCRAAARVIDEGDRFVVAQGAFLDLERNVAITYETRRRITDRDGKRFNDDMVGVTAAAACSIALRNSVMKGVPKAFWKRSYDQAVQTYRGNSATLVERRDTMLEYFTKIGVKENRVLVAIGKPSIEAIDLDDLVRLRGFATAIKDGDSTIDETFPEHDAKDIADQLTKPRTPQDAPPPDAADDKPDAEDEAEAEAFDRFIEDVRSLDKLPALTKARGLIPADWSEKHRHDAGSAIEVRVAEVQAKQAGKPGQRQLLDSGPGDV